MMGDGGGEGDEHMSLSTRIFTGRKRSLRRLCFYSHSFHGVGRGELRGRGCVSRPRARVEVEGSGPGGCLCPHPGGGWGSGQGGV